MIDRGTEGQRWTTDGVVNRWGKWPREEIEERDD